MNQIIPKSNLKYTKGGDSLKAYTYKGDSGKLTIVMLVVQEYRY